MSERFTPDCSDEPELAALVALASLPGLTPKRLWGLLGLGPPTAVWCRAAEGRVPPSRRADDPAPRWPAYTAGVDPSALLDAHHEAGIGIAAYGTAGYPSRLLDDPEPPAVLFRAGPGSPLDRVAVGVVGTRRCTHYGREIAFELGAELASRGIDVVSGLAHGIDASAHAGARRSDPACCVGVVASGLDVVYPRGNRALWKSVSEQGCLVSEWPLGAPSVPWRFPARNRLIAGLSVASVVVESAERGGSLYTVDEAMRRDRPVFAVPGSIRSVASAGTNRLIVDGAVPLTSIADFAEALAPCAAVARTDRPADDDRPANSWLLEVIGWEPMTVDAVLGASGRSPAEVTLEVERQIRAGTVRRSGARLERRR